MTPARGFEAGGEVSYMSIESEEVSGGNGFVASPQPPSGPELEMPGIGASMESGGLSGSVVTDANVAAEIREVRSSLPPGVDGLFPMVTKGEVEEMIDGRRREMEEIAREQSNEVSEEKLREFYTGLI